MPFPWDWHGRGEGLTDRDSKILVLITQGLDNDQVAACAFLSPVKSYIRSLYRKIDVTSRTQAVLWGVDHGFSPPTTGESITGAAACRGPSRPTQPPTTATTTITVGVAALNSDP